MGWTFGHALPADRQDNAETGAHDLKQRAAERARRAWLQLLLLLPLLAGVLVAYHYRHQPGAELPIRIASVVLLVVIGFALTRSIARALHPVVLKRLDPGAAGTVDFLIHLAGLGLALIVALRLAGVRPSTLAVGGAMTAVVAGMAAQQTLGNLFAGMVLLTARPFRVGDRIRVQAGALAGGSDGEVRSVGLFYTTLAAGAKTTAVPNSVVVSSAIVPLREPAAVEIRARLHREVKPSALQGLLDESVQTPTRGQPYIDVEEIDQSEVVMCIAATPQSGDDGARLADEILDAVGEVLEPEPAGAPS
jgi:small-conductance mechanosensitive channel